MKGFTAYKENPAKGKLATYKETSITTQSKGRLIVLLYEGAIKFMNLAIQEIEAGDYEAKGRYISRALDIMTELNVVLDMEAGGEIAVNLRKLYMFIIRHLTEANIKNDANMIREVTSLMRGLNESWKAISD